MQKLRYGPLKTHAVAYSDVMDAHRSHRWCPWFNSLFNFFDRGVKTQRDRENTADLFLHNTLRTRQGLRLGWTDEGIDRWMDGWMHGRKKKTKQKQKQWFEEWQWCERTIASWSNTQLVRAGYTGTCGIVTWGRGTEINTHLFCNNKSHPSQIHSMTVHFYALLQKEELTWF